MQAQDSLHRLTGGYVFDDNDPMDGTSIDCSINNKGRFEKVLGT